jgi:hypothetical protein
MIHIITWPGGCVVDYITFNRIQMIVKSTRTLGGYGCRILTPNAPCVLTVLNKAGMPMPTVHV